MKKIKFGKCLLLELLQKKGMTQSELSEKNRYNRVANLSLRRWKKKNVVFKCC